MGVEHLDRAKKARDDEYYTRKEDVEMLVDIFADDLRGKVVYCNCDGGGSWFVRVLKSRQAELGIKEVLYSSTDYKSEDNKHLLERCDIVMTNPPFSKITEYIPYLLDNNKDFIIIANKLIVQYSTFFKYFKNNVIYPIDITVQWFIRPDGQSVEVSGKVFTTLDRYRDKINNKLKMPTKIEKSKKPVYIEKYDAYNIDRSTLLNQYKQYDRFLVPITFIYKKDIDLFDIIDFVDDVFVDCKQRFRRMLIERKSKAY